MVIVRVRKPIKLTELVTTATAGGGGGGGGPNRGASMQLPGKFPRKATLEHCQILGASCGGGGKDGNAALFFGFRPAVRTAPQLPRFNRFVSLYGIIEIFRLVAPAARSLYECGRINVQKPGYYPC